MGITSEVSGSLVLAGVAVLLALSMIMFDPSNTSEVIPWDGKMLVGGVFIACSIFGAALAVSPGWIRRISKKNTLKSRPNLEQPDPSFSGHHPDCDRFQSHRIVFYNKTWCAGCLGLFIGAIGSIALIIMYMVIPVQPSQNILLLGFLTGTSFIVLLYGETIRRNSHAFSHLFLNAMLVPAFFLITVSVTEITKKTSYGLFAVLLCALWVSTRVTLSRWNHRITCQSCKESCKMYTVRSQL